MDSAGSSSFLVSILLAMLFIMPALARVGVKKNVIGDICSKTQDSSLCWEVFNSNPAAGKADLQGLARITVDLASANAAKTLQQLHSLIAKTSEIKLKEGYTICSKHYDNVISNLGGAQQDLRIGDPNGINLEVSASMDEAGNCDETLKGLVVDPSIKKGSQDLNKIGSIILVISNLLPQ